MLRGILINDFVFPISDLFISNICQKDTLKPNLNAVQSSRFPVAYRAVCLFACALQHRIRSFTKFQAKRHPIWVLLSPDTLRCLRANSQSLAVCPLTCLFTQTSSLTSPRLRPLGWRVCVATSTFIIGANIHNHIITRPIIIFLGSTNGRHKHGHTRTGLFRSCVGTTAV